MRAGAMVPGEMMDDPAHRMLKVGELARRTGVSVRTLHHYDEIGLLRPSHRTPTGHRLYGAEDVARLQQVKSLRQLGLSLDEVRDCLARPDHSARRVIDLHLARLREQMALQQQLYERLDGLGRWLDAWGESDAAPGAPLAELVKIVEMMTMVESYYTP